jgi:hypothetical protein
VIRSALEALDNKALKEFAFDKFEVTFLRDHGELRERLEAILRGLREGECHAYSCEPSTRGSGLPALTRARGHRAKSPQAPQADRILAAVVGGLCVIGMR